MNYQDTQIGQQVVRSKGDYVVGRIGEIIERDEDKKRVRVALHHLINRNEYEPQ